MGEINFVMNAYEGAYGLTIRIDTQSVEAVRRVRNILLDMAKSEGHSLDLVEAVGAQTTGLSKLILKNIERKKDSNKKLRLISGSNSPMAFEWALSSDNWMELTYLIESLIEHDSPGHHYLTEEGIDDAIVELALKEYNTPAVKEKK